MSNLVSSCKWILLISALTIAQARSCAALNRITIVNDSFGKQPALEQDWGYSALIEFEGRRILFDTGDNIALFQRNVERLHIDLSHLDMVVISHAHGDHSSGLRFVLSQNPNVPLYVPDDPFFAGNTLPPSFLTTDAQAQLPPEMRYFRGGPPPQPKGWAAWSDTKMKVVNEATTITPHIRLVALISEKPAFRGLREISLVLDTSQGPVIVAGCSHPGIERIMAAATASDPSRPVYMLFGGLHLLQDSREQIASTLDVLANQYRLQKIAVGHCTGELAFLMIQQKWNAHTAYAGLGETIQF